MPILNLKVLEGSGYVDIAPPAGCCGDQKPSMPMCFFCLRGSAVTWMTDPAPINGGKVRWGKQFDTIHITEHESAQLHFVVVDGAHWRPRDTRRAVDMSKIPEKNFYGENMVSVATFEMMKREEHKITLKARNPDGTPSSQWSGSQIKIEAYYEDGNIDDHRIGVNQGNFVEGPAVPPPAQPQQYPPQQYPPQQYPPQQQQYQQYPPQQQYQQYPPQQQYDTQPYPPAGDPAV